MKRSLKLIEPKTLGDQILYAYVVTIEEVGRVVRVIATSIPLWAVIDNTVKAGWLRHFFG